MIYEDDGDEREDKHSLGGAVSAISRNKVLLEAAFLRCPASELALRRLAQILLPMRWLASALS